MSVDSTALERSALERKERDELVTIAQALGGKPAARAAKATIVNLILELTGVAGGGDEPAAAPARAPRARKAAGGATASAKAEPEAPTEEPAVEEPTTSDDDDDADAQGDDVDVVAEPAEDRGAPDGGGQARQPQQGGGGGDGGLDGDDEGGNRRRRRRGRNRERTGDNPQGGGGGGQPDEWVGDPVDVSGIVDLRDEGYGFLRVHGFLPSRDDAYISVKQARQFGLRRGDLVAGASRPALRNEKNPALLRIDTVNGVDAEKSRGRRRFEDLTPLFPDAKLKMELDQSSTDMTARIIDLIAPIGKGQRGLIVSPPKAGKTTIMKQIARSIEINDPEVHLFVLLVDERPEEVTDMRRWLKNDTSTVVASTFDRPAEEHTQVAELVSERAKRLVEDGADVVIILDGITRLARAYNLAAPTTGRVMSGGIDTGALYPPKKFFGAARNVEEGGSLTILATALVETGSRMDEVIFEEFKGTGNMELRLDRRLAERRVYPAIDVDASSTRHEELLFLGTQLQQVWKLRRTLQALASEGTGQVPLELLIDRMQAFKSNQEFLAEIAKVK
jgi:transcription termination factor Rho